MDIPTRRMHAGGNLRDVYVSSDCDSSQAALAMTSSGQYTLAHTLAAACGDVKGARLPESWGALLSVSSAARRLQACVPGSSLSRMLESSPPSRLQTAAFYLAEVDVADCDSSQAALAMTSSGQYTLAHTLAARLRTSTRRTLDARNATAGFLVFPDSIYVDHRHLPTQCDACARALAAAMAPMAPIGHVATAISFPMPRWASEIQGSTAKPPPPACTLLWTGPQLQHAAVLSIEGAQPVPARPAAASAPTLSTDAASALSCGWQQHTRRGWVTAQDWSFSVPYPRSHEQLWQATRLLDVRAFEARKRRVSRPIFCAYTGGARTLLRRAIDRHLQRGGHTARRAYGGQARTWHYGNRTCVFVSTSQLYERSQYCLMPAGTTLSRHAFFQAISSGCVPVSFSADWRCAFYDVAYRSHLPVQARRGFGAGHWSVLLDEARAMREPSYIEEALASIPARSYERMLRAVVQLIPHVTYFVAPIAHLRDAAHLAEDLLLGRAHAPFCLAKGHAASEQYGGSGCFWDEPEAQLLSVSGGLGHRLHCLATLQRIDPRFHVLQLTRRPQDALPYTATTRDARPSWQLHAGALAGGAPRDDEWSWLDLGERLERLERIGGPGAVRNPTAERGSTALRDLSLAAARFRLFPPEQPEDGSLPPRCSLLGVFEEDLKALNKSSVAALESSSSSYKQRHISAAFRRAYVNAFRSLPIKDELRQIASGFARAHHLHERGTVSLCMRTGVEDAPFHRGSSHLAWPALRTVTEQLLRNTRVSVCGGRACKPRLLVFSNNAKATELVRDTFSDNATVVDARHFESSTSNALSALEKEMAELLILSATRGYWIVDRGRHWMAQMPTHTIVDAAWWLGGGRASLLFVHGAARQSKLPDEQPNVWLHTR
eukprot:CAMPEP_0119397774 /NCGR_PEP_ID=MMETSP1334-20130426/140504_1 /TAXON_ID=127549 /ORGANISM="Calcidiscus leptoporus, Strain RCC1130" /LENGTH=888 /DNA_ID=CAMNT_0007421619 /DNA_START=272 /DNA_END=2940 /DNA_ORIENTATION=-